VLDSHENDDPRLKVERWPTFGGVTLPKWIRLCAEMGLEVPDSHGEPSPQRVSDQTKRECGKTWSRLQPPSVALPLFQFSDTKPVISAKPAMLIDDRLLLTAP
jgi:hypothetical protein